VIEDTVNRVIPQRLSVNIIDHTSEEVNYALVMNGDCCSLSVPLFCLRACRCSIFVFNKHFLLDGHG